MRLALLAASQATRTKSVRPAVTARVARMWAASWMAPTRSSSHRCCPDLNNHLNRLSVAASNGAPVTNDSAVTKSSSQPLSPRRSARCLSRTNKSALLRTPPVPRTSSYVGLVPRRAPALMLASGSQSLPSGRVPNRKRALVARF